MSKNVRTQIGKVVGKSLDAYHKRMKPTVDELKFKEQYQGRIIDCMVGEVDDNYIETPETDAPIVKLEHSKEGVVKIPSIKGKTILVDADGNETDTPAEGCRLVSVSESEDNKLIILSKNKNLFDINKFKDPNNWITKGTSYRSFEIKLKPNTEYCFSRKDNSGYGLGSHILINTVAGSYVGSLGWIMHSDSANINMQSGKFVTPDNGIIYLSFIPNGIDVILNAFKEFQIELGKTPTSYIEPKHHKTEILLKEPLRSIPNGVQDEIVGNKIIRRVGSIILDGNKRVHVWNNSTGDTVNGYQYFHYYKEDNNVKNYCKIYNNILPSNKGGHIAKQEGFVYTNYIGFSIHKDRLGVEDVNDYLNNQEKVSQWFKDNRIEFLYELKEPIIEELPNGITLQGFDDTTMYIENSITPMVTYGYNALIPYKQELSNQKEEVEINTLDIENNIIPYLMNMEFNLMTMEDK